MKLSVAFVFCLASGINACTLEKIIPDPVKEVRIDNENNVHVISIRNLTHIMTNLDSENKVVREIEKAGPVKESYFITGKGKKVYFTATEPAVESSQNNESCKATFYKYSKENVSSTVYDNLTCKGAKIFMDRDDILFFNTANGVFLVRSDQDNPVPIENLENYTFYHSIEDTHGNVFLASDTVNSIFVITESAKKSSKPSATKVPDQPNKPLTKFVNYYYSNNALAVYNHDNDGELRQMLPNVLPRVFWPFPGNYYGHFLTKENGELYFSHTFDYNVKIALPITPGSMIWRSVGLGKYSIDREGEVIAVDSSGIIFIPSTDGKLVKHQAGEYDSPTAIDIPNKDVIEAIALDKDQNVWIVANHLHRFFRGTGSLEEKSNSTFKGIGNSPAILKINKGTQLYVGSDSGLYTCKLF